MAQVNLLTEYLQSKDLSYNEIIDWKRKLKFIIAFIQYQDITQYFKYLFPDDNNLLNNDEYSLQSRDLTSRYISKYPDVYKIFENYYFDNYGSLPLLISIVAQAPNQDNLNRVFNLFQKLHRQDTDVQSAKKLFAHSLLQKNTTTHKFASNPLYDYKNLPSLITSYIGETFHINHIYECKYDKDQKLIDKTIIIEDKKFVLSPSGYISMLYIQANAVELKFLLEITRNNRTEYILVPVTHSNISYIFLFDNNYREITTYSDDILNLVKRWYRQYQIDFFSDN